MRNIVSKEQFVNGAFWKIIETLMSVGTTLIVSIVLARLLDADAFGIIALANVVINFSEIILQSAFLAPLIQKDNIDDVDYTSVLIFSLICATGLYIIVYGVSPIFAKAYSKEILTPVLRVISIIFIFQAMSSVRTAIISRNMRFKTLSICTVIASVSSGVLGVLLALFNLGVWALVIQKIAYQAVLNIVLFWVINWKPKLKGISLKRVRGLLSFGSKVFGSSIISYISDSSISIVTGKAYSVSALGYSSKGVQYPCDVSIFSFQAIATSLFPTLASYQHDIKSQKAIMRKVVSVVAFLLFPMMFGMFAVSDRLIIFLLTDKWLLSVPFMKIACIYYCATPLMLINIQLYHSQGNGDIRLFLELIKLICTLSCLYFGVVIFKFSLVIIFVFRTCIEVLIALISVVGLKKVINYSFFEYFTDIIKPFLQSILMALVVKGMGLLLSFNNGLVLLCQILLGAISYLILSVLLKPVGYIEFMRILRERLFHENNFSNL